jgi:hypothetical protein
VEVATDAGLLDLDFAGPEALGCPNNRMVDGLIEILHIVGVESHFRSKERRVENHVLVTRRAIEPGEIAEGKRGLQIYRRSSGRSRYRLTLSTTILPART